MIGLVKRVFGLIAQRRIGDLPPASGALWAFIIKKAARLPAKARVSLDARANILARCGALRETMPPLALSA
jgi:hypothetical protein